MRFIEINRISSLYSLFRWLSFDVALGAIICQRFFLKLFEVTPSLEVTLSLFFAVLFIYNSDHWIDSRQEEAHGFRRIFYQQHSMELGLFCLALLVLGIMVSWNLPQILFLYGTFFGLICGGYLLVVYFFPRFGWKDFLVATCYTLGVVLAPVVLGNQMHTMEWIMTFQFLGIALVNVLIFSFFDYESDRLSGFSSIAVKYGNRLTGYLIAGIIGFLFLSEVAIILMSPEYLKAQITLATMTSLLLVIFFFQDFFYKEEYYRMLGDGVFFIPICFLL